MGKFSNNLETLVYRFILSLIVGFFLGSYLITHSDSNAATRKQQKISCIKKYFSSSSAQAYTDANNYDEIKPITRLNNSHGILYIGMMSTAKNRESRVEAIMNTFAKYQQHIKLEIFSNINGTSGDGSKRTITLKNGAKIIQLPGVSDNSYPPQRKSFSMLKFIHDNYLDKFDWFLRADDDTYFKIDGIIKLLSRIDPNKPYVIGRAGYGKHADDYMKPGENYCMGGPGIFLSREMMRRIGPNLAGCLREMYTEHEDVELGRCIRKVTGVQCTESWETTALFFQNYDNSGTYGSNIKEISYSKRTSALSFHSNKDPKYQYKLHTNVTKDQMKTYLTKISKMDNEMNKMTSQLIGSEFDTKGWNIHKGCNWDYISRHSMYSSSSQLVRGIHSASKLTAVNNVFETISQLRKTYGLLMTAHIREISVMRSRYIANPLTSLDMISSLKAQLTVHKKYVTIILNRIHYRRAFANKATFLNEQIPLEASLANLPKPDENMSRPETFSVFQERVNFIMALSGRPQNLVRFLQNYKEVFLANSERVSLTVVYFPENGISHTDEIINADDKSMQFENTTGNFVLQNLKQAGLEYPGAQFNFIKVAGGVPFSRGIGLQMGAQTIKQNDEVDEDELIFFCDVDLLFSREILSHIRRSTIRGQQVYYPTFFSQYDPNIVYAEQKPPETHFYFEEIAGFWRTFSYGMVSIYKSDFEKTGGFDLSINGWGLEDLKFCDAILKTAGLQVFKANEPAMVHLYHDKNCPRDLTKKQYEDCQNSRAQHFGPKSYLYYLWRKKMEHDEGEYDPNIKVIS